MSGFMAEVRGQNDLTNLRLANIEAQTTKTSERVTRIETEPHPLENCPNGALLLELKDNMVSARAERKFIVRIGSGLAVIISALAAVLALIF
jgi:hypothetical protein